MPFYPSAAEPRTRLALFQRSLVQDEATRFKSLLTDERIADLFAEEGISFGDDEDAVYTPAVTLWGLLSQAFFKVEQRSCLAAVVRIAALWLSLGRLVSSTNTGAYCRARRRITAEFLRKLARRTADAALERSQRRTGSIDAGIGPASEYSGGRLILVDGFTVTAADTAENQAQYPQNPAQKPGLGFPILRGVVLVCLRSGLLLDAELGPYSGKGTGETALFWKLLDVLRSGDVVVADSYYCTYWLLAACRARGVHVVMRNHHLRDDAPAEARRLVRGQCLATWPRPPRPQWMDEATYATMPATLEVRLVESVNDVPGQRTEKLVIATTLLDHRAYDDRWLAGLYRGRWRVELDIRAIKVTLGMDVLRARTPEMVRTELWSCLTVYNLLRQSMLEAALRADCACRELSLTATLQLFGNLWLAAAVHQFAGDPRELRLAHQATIRVGNRPNRNEPRENKRRPKLIKLMTRPRAESRRRCA